ncbi:MAG: hypothetical protein NVV59_02105 [Chitinophagaceae bacterium]|nr:hypothetical protein [Chitinophagaceae bacterium]
MKTLSLAVACLLSISVFAQDFESKGFKKENLFTGGSLSVGFSNNSFQIGGNPMFGYSIAPWLDAGVVVNYNYASFRDWYIYDDKMRQSTYGAGAFTRLFPIRFLFAHAQIEQNYTRLKYIPNDGTSSSTASVNGPSLLLGAGYSTNRQPGYGQPFFYVSLLFDVLGDETSPYIDERGRAIPIVRAGLQVPLFQGRGR